MRILLSILFLLTLTGCRFYSSSDSKKPTPGSKNSTPATDGFKVKELKDTIKISFRTRAVNYSRGQLDSIINVVTRKGFFKPDTDRNGKIRFYREKNRILKVAYDSADMRVFVDNNYMLNNILITSVAFSGKRSFKNPKYKPGFLLQEWWFSSNTDRDSAIRWINYVFNHPKSIVMYEKSYPQIMTASNRIIILTTGFDIWEKYVIEYKDIVGSFLKKHQK